MQLEQILFSQGFGTRHECRGLIFTKRVDHYMCMKCGAKWESEPYKY